MTEAIYLLQQDRGGRRPPLLLAGAGHRLDSSSASMLNGPEHELSAHWRRCETPRGEVLQLPGWQLVEELLERFGAAGETVRRRASP